MKSVQSKNNSSANSKHFVFLQKESTDNSFGTTEKPFFNLAPVQAKLTVNKPNDPYEKEADAMADKVVQRLSSKPFSNSENNQKPFFTKSVTPLQSKCTECEKEEKLQKKEEVEEKDLLKDKLQRKSIFESNEEPGAEEKNIQKKSAEAEHKNAKGLPREFDHASLQKEAGRSRDNIAKPLSESKSESKNKNGNAVQKAPLITATSAIPLVQPKCAACEPEEKLQKKEDDEGRLKDKLQKKPIFESNEEPPEDERNIQRKCVECEGEDKLQKKAGSSSEILSPNIESALSSGKGSGSALPHNTRNQMESAFGADFSGVRIHNNNEAVQMNKDLSAQAFTHGNDIYFNAGKYDTNSTIGQHLIAHELTHTVQQNAAVQKKEVPQIQKDDGDDPISSAVSKVYDALDGWTDSDDSYIIWNQFDSTTKDTTDKIISGVASKANLSIDDTMTWMFSDMVTADWNNLFGHFITVNAYRIDYLIASQVYSYLSGYTSDSDSNAILTIYTGSTPVTGDLLGRSIVQLEAVTGYGRDDAAEYLFGDLTSLDAYKLSLHFFNSGDITASGYAAYWIAAKVRDLISGFTGMADSAAIVSNFERVPPELRSVVLYELEKISQAKWQQTAAEALMGDMWQSDYEKLRVLMPELPVYNIEKNWLEWIWETLKVGYDLLSSLIEYGICGLIGIIWGIITVVIDVIVAIVDIGIAVIDILGMIVYFVTGGRFCKENKDRVWAFFGAMGQLFGAPRDAVTAMWDELTLEASLIEGPFSACQKAIFWTSRITNLVVNIILIFAWGYGAVKTALKGIEAVVSLARAGELINALKALPAKMLSAIRNLPAATSKAILVGASKVISLIKNPIEIISAVRNSLTVVRLAAEDEGYFKFLRKQAGNVVEGESKFWQERRDFWKKNASTIEGGVSETEKNITTAVESIPVDSAKAEALISQAEQDAKASKVKADELMDDVNGKKAADDPGNKKPEPTPGTEPKVKIEEPSIDGERRVQVDEAGHCKVCNSPCDEIKKKYKAAIDRVIGRNFNAELDAIEANNALTPDQKMPFYKVLEQELDYIQDVLKIMDDAKTKNFRKAGNYHADTRHNMSDAIVRQIISNPDNIYVSNSGNQFIYHKGGDMAVVRATPRSSKGNVVTAYGSSGIKGESGARALGGLPTDPAPPVTDAMIAGGQIPDAAGGFIPPARRIWP